MKKSIISLAIAAGMAASGAAMAGDSTVYGNVHLSLNAADNDIANADNNLSISSNTSDIGVKGSEDLGDGMKAIYKVEFQIAIANGPTTDPDTGAPQDANGALTGRDQFVGLQGGMGTIKFGTMSSNYKQMGGKVDPLYRTPLEGRGFLKTHSNLHNGNDINRGRQRNTVQYDSPKMGGIQAVVNTTFSGSGEESTGLGIRYTTKNILVYLDWIDSQVGNAAAACIGATVCATEAATKIGGKFDGDGFSVAAQFESAEDRTGNDYTFLAGTFDIDKNNMIAVTYGMAAAKAANSDTDGVAVAFDHKMSKMTNVYVGYGTKGSDVANSDESMLTAGIRKKF
ncbi:MAG: porin [Gammaproteobacteria bacterium]